MASITGAVKVLCANEVRDIQKRNLSSTGLKVGWELEGDAHEGEWCHQVSLISYNKAREFNGHSLEVLRGCAQDCAEKSGGPL